YDRRVFRVLAITCSLAAPVFVYYGGVFAPSSAAAILLGIGFLGLGDDRVFAVGSCIAGIVNHLALSVLILTGTIPDLGIFKAELTPMVWRVFMMGVIPAIYMLALWHARMARRATTTAVTELDAALRAAGGRDATLDEAHEALDVALYGARRGRYTDEIVGPYRLHELIGRGSFGEVYAATDRRDGSQVAMKLLQVGVDQQPEHVQRLLREAEALRRL